MSYTASIATREQLEIMAEAEGCRYLDFDESSANGTPETHSGSLQMFHPECGFEKVPSMPSRKEGAAVLFTNVFHRVVYKLSCTLSALLSVLVMTAGLKKRVESSLVQPALRNTMDRSTCGPSRGLSCSYLPIATENICCLLLVAM